MRRPLSSLALALTAVLALAACQGSAPDTIEVTVPDALTAPGTALALGETARLPGIVQTDANGDEVAEVAVTVTGLRELDVSVLDRFVPVPEFEGATPVGVLFQVDLATTSDDVFNVSGGDLDGVLADGQVAFSIRAAQSRSACGLPTGMAGPPPVVECVIVLVPEGAELAGVAWNPYMLRALVDPAPFDAYADETVAWSVTS